MLAIKTWLLNQIYNIITLAAGIFSWVIICNGLHLSGVAPAAVAVFSFVGLNVSSTVMSLILGSLIQACITCYYFSWRYSSWNKIHKLSIVSIFAIVMIVFGSYLSLYSVSYRSNSESTYQTYKETIIREARATAELENMVGQQYELYMTTSIQSLQYEKASKCRCLCESKQHKLNLVQNVYGGSIGQYATYINVQEALNKSAIKKVAYNIIVEDESDENLLSLFQELQIRREKLLRYAEDYVIFMESKKQGLLNIENLGITGAVRKLQGYNPRTFRCLAFTNSLKLQHAQLNTTELEKFKTQVLTPSYLELKKTFEIMVAKELIPINRITLTKHWIDEQMHPEFYKNTSLLINLVVAFAADIVALTMMAFASMTNNGMNDKITRRKQEASQMSRLADINERANEAEKRLQKAEMLANARNRAYEVMKKAFKKK